MELDLKTGPLADIGRVLHVLHGYENPGCQTQAHRLIPSPQRRGQRNTTAAGAEQRQ